MKSLTVSQIAARYCAASDRQHDLWDKRVDECREGLYRREVDNHAEDAADIERRCWYDIAPLVRATNAHEAAILACFIETRIDCLEASHVDENYLAQSYTEIKRLCYGILAGLLADGVELGRPVEEHLACRWRDDALPLPERQALWIAYSGCGDFPEWLQPDVKVLHLDAAVDAMGGGGTG